MSFLNQDRPLLARQVYTMPSALGIFPGSGFPETKRSRVTRIMQSIQRGAQSQPFPNQLAGARLTASGEFELLFSKGVHGSPRRAGPTKSLEKMPYCVLELFIGIEHDTLRRIINQSHRQGHLQFAPLGF